MLFKKLNISYFARSLVFCALFFFSSLPKIRGQEIPQPQNFKEKIENYRAHYQEKFRANPRAPLKTDEDFSYMRFYEADSTYSLECSFKRTPEAIAFQMPTYSGALQRTYVQFGVLTFKLKDSTRQLLVYQNLSLNNNPAFQGYLFVPFKDITNGTETYGGGRYIEIWQKDIRNGKVILDFNTCYNPYCAYSDGYSCPIPPSENHLPVKIEAGEKIFEKHK